MYFIALVLPQHLNEKVLKYKNIMLEKYNCRVGLKSPAHITLVPPFWMEEEKEEQLINNINYNINSLSNELSSFHIATSNFSAFKPQTIFIAPEPNDDLNTVKKAIDDFFKNNSFYNIKIDPRPFHPHITIATRDLYKKSFYEIWPWFAEKKFTEEWTAEGVSILRHNKKNWDVIHTSQFENS
jgi:2'-5' RNA ligase